MLSEVNKNLSVSSYIGQFKICLTVLFLNDFYRSKDIQFEEKNFI